jgi:outer membrane lipoprotein SlyB
MNKFMKMCLMPLLAITLVLPSTRPVIAQQNNQVEIQPFFCGGNLLGITGTVPRGTTWSSSATSTGTMNGTILGGQQFRAASGGVVNRRVRIELTPVLNPNNPNRFQWVAASHLGC